MPLGEAGDIPADNTTASVRALNVRSPCAHRAPTVRNPAPPDLEIPGAGVAMGRASVAKVTEPTRSPEPVPGAARREPAHNTYFSVFQKPYPRAPVLSFAVTSFRVGSALNKKNVASYLRPEANPGLAWWLDAVVDLIQEKNFHEKSELRGPSDRA